MLSKQNLQFLLVVYGFMHVQIVSSCSCPMRSPQNVFCEADYALKAFVASETLTFRLDREGESTTTESAVDRYNRYVEYTYEIRIEHVFRSTQWYEFADKKVVSAGIQGCILRLQPETTYLLMGRIIYPRGGDGSSALGVFCDGMSRWDDASFENWKNNPPQCSENQVRTRKDSDT